MLCCMGDERRDRLATVGPRLRELRTRRGLTLADLAERTGINASTLSRLEGGARKPTLEMLLPLAEVYAIPLDELVGAPRTGDPRIHLKPVSRDGMTYIPLSTPGGVQAHKLLIPPRPNVRPELQSHAGFEWLYVLSGRLRLVLGDESTVLKSGEAAEFDTHIPHWLGADGDQPAELLILFGRQGERAHLRARGG
ncbi:transcriptional regulator, XRE family with cupin sensor [Williamsia sterculiae]|uniref:Transcriptional regulator, XRE family with cupin sensor n=2 Tax=Williamsia sterculiae TaxID=1344003 RepID=A0A1N7F7W7_9NOCA|nr:transcriptional regulator, XRE family with cupin sensor [Williamsia sterculiae]